MRLKDYDGKDGKKVWLNEDELSMLLENFNDSPEQIIGSRLYEVGFPGTKIYQSQVTTGGWVAF